MKKEGRNYRAVRDFVDEHFRHFNSLTLKLAARAYREHISGGGKMFLAMAGAMSTAEIGTILAEMIRQEKIHGISCTGANIEEDLFNLVAHDSYRLLPDYRNLSPDDEEELYRQHYSRVTDVCIPEEEAMRKIERHMKDLWLQALNEGRRYFPYEYFYQLIVSGRLKDDYRIDPADSWLVAACEKNIPVFVPGWEDSTIGNYFASLLNRKIIPSTHIVKSGLETMNFLIDWYKETSRDCSIGFFQIGGGIAGDFPVCVVPVIQMDLDENCDTWGYFCQISDSTTSYGSYSGATPNEKITWGKIKKDTPRFMIESDATIVAPLIFAYVLSE